ncbi:MAG: serine/threonine protein kinase, partial [Planctomycetaceae bacterium]
MGESDSRDDLREHELQAVVPIFDQFEHDCIAGLAPSIEKIRDELEPRYRQYVVVNCVRIELEQAKTVTRQKCDDYLRRFPSYESDLLQAFEDFEDKITDAVEEPSGSDTEPMPSSTAEDTAAGFQSLVDGDNYTFISLLGGGNFGTVYLAHSKKLDQNVAIKVMNDSAPNDPKSSEREVQVLRCLCHPSIVRLLDVTQTNDGRQALVQEYVDGINLSEYIKPYQDSKNDFLPWAQAVHLTLEIANALVHVHEAGVFHSDLKPSNILLREVDGQLQPVLADFGLSMLRWQRNMNHRGFVGTYTYASPEQFRDESPLPHVPWARSDIYSLGVVLYRLLTNLTPFKNIKSCDARKVPPEPPRSVRAEVPLR